MKKAVILVIIIGAIALLYFVNNRSTEIALNSDSIGENGSSHPDPSNATFMFDDGPITLSAGTATRSIEGSSVLTEDVSLWGSFLAYGDINDDKKEDAAVIITRTSGGSGFFIYVAPFFSKTGSYKGGNAVFLGDRIAPKDISIKNGIITVEYLDRAEREPMAAEPTIPATKHFVMQSGTLVER
jgi:hypothetical protein